MVFISAEAREFDGLRKHLRNSQKLAWRIQFATKGELNGQPVVLASNGPGPNLAGEAAEQAAANITNVHAFVSTGYCGALDPILKPLDIIIASDVNGNQTNAPKTGLHYTAGPLLSQDAVACTVQEKAKLRDTGAIAVEMEAAGIEPVARKMSVPFYCVRVVTDAASESLALDFNKVRDRNGRFSRARIVAKACRHPARVVPELLKFDRTCKSASLALGDFIANCRF